MVSETYIYRRRFPLVVIVSACFLFTVILILDWLAVLHFGWFQHAPWLSFSLLLFLGLSGLWVFYMLANASCPVIVINGDEATFIRNNLPSCGTTISLESIQTVTAVWQPDTVPSFLVLQVKNIDSTQLRSNVWTKTRGNQLYFECSNLSLTARQIAVIFQQRISAQSRSASSVVN